MRLRRCRHWRGAAQEDAGAGAYAGVAADTEAVEDVGEGEVGIRQGVIYFKGQTYKAPPTHGAYPKGPGRQGQPSPEVQAAEAAAKAATESLLSGDGSMMTSVISTCLSDPKYKIGVNDKKSDGSYSVTNTNAYLYIDGSHYYRLNLTAPYITAKPVMNPCTWGAKKAFQSHRQCNSVTLLGL